MRTDLARDEVAHDDPDGTAVFHHQLQHLRAGIHRDRAQLYLVGERLVGAELQLLARLATGVKRPRDLGAAERTVVEQAAIFTRERHTLGNTLVDDRGADLRETVRVRFARAIVAALERVIEEAVDAVAVVFVVLGSVDPTLGRDGVSPPWAVLETERFDVVAKLPERRRGRSAGEARADDDDVELTTVARRDELHVEFVRVPLVFKWSRWDFCFELHGVLLRRPRR